MRLVVLSVLEENFVHVCAGILKQFVGAVEYDKCDLAVAQDAELVRLLHEAELALGESNLHARNIS